MKKGDYAELKMKKTLSAQGKLDESVHACELLEYRERQECLLLRMEQSELTELSLDGIYDCKIWAQKEQYHCTGRIKERYFGENGKIVKFQIENGFYKINIKSVDN